MTAPRAALFLTAIVLAATAGAAPPAPKLQLTGDVPKGLALTVEELAALPHREVSVKGTRGGTERFEGVSVSELLARAGVELGEKAMGSDHLATSVIAEGGDDYRAALSMAEVDPAYTAGDAIVADRQDGKPLGESGGWFRLVVPGDKTHSRWVHHLVSLRVVKAPKGRD